LLTIFPDTRPLPVYPSPPIPITLCSLGCSQFLLFLLCINFPSRIVAAHKHTDTNSHTHRQWQANTHRQTSRIGIEKGYGEWVLESDSELEWERPQGPLKDNTRLRWTAASDVGTRIWRIYEIKSVEIISVCWKVCHEQLSQDAISFGQSILASAANPLHLESDFKRRHVSRYLEYVSTLRLRFVLQYVLYNFLKINLFLLNENSEITIAIFSKIFYANI